MRPILAFAAAMLVSVPAYADPLAPGAYDYIDGCIILNSDTLIAYGTAPIAFPRPIFSCGDPAGPAILVRDALGGPADPPMIGDIEEVGLELPPDLVIGITNPERTGNAVLPEESTTSLDAAADVPEPAAVGLIGLGMSVLGLARRRRALRQDANPGAG